MPQVTSAMWAPLRDALPTFAATWSARPDDGESTHDVWDELHAFEEYVRELVKSDPASLEPMFGPLEMLLADGGEELNGMLTVTVVEALAEAADEAGIDLAVIARKFAGPATHAAWVEGLKWTHPEGDWDGERVVLRFTPPHILGSVRVLSTVASADGESVDMTCELLDGDVRAGWYSWHARSSAYHEARRISSVETIDGEPGMATRLRLRVEFAPDEDADFRRLLGDRLYDLGTVLGIVDTVPPETVGWYSPEEG
ncbi:MAG TPA: hypothetical protein VFK13_07660 [Gemmatimonadaceae bacterium]|nr:hypothetical protein [Gemmatimonadaceae bacterium]